VLASSMASGFGTDSGCAALPFAFLEISILLRLARPPRAGAASGVSEGCSGLDSRWAVFRLREGAGAGGGGGWGLELGVLSLALARVDDRVTLEDDMSWGSEG
jgi:hypothetical protein